VQNHFQRGLELHEKQGTLNFDSYSSSSLLSKALSR